MTKIKCSFCNADADCWSTLHAGRNKKKQPEVTYFACYSDECGEKLLDATSADDRNSTTGLSLESYKEGA